MIFNAIHAKSELTEGRAPWDDYWYTDLGRPTASGQDISNDQALGVSAFYCGVNLLANALKTLPLFVYRRLEDGGKELLRDHPVFTLLHEAPNRWQTAGKFRWWMQASAILWGNAFARIVRNGNKVVELVPVHPSRFAGTRLRKGTDTLLYQFRTVAGIEDVDEASVLHHFGPSRNGVVGDSIVSLARETLGFNLALERSGAGFFGRGARPIGIIKHPGHFRQEQESRRFREQWQAAFSGDGAHGTAVLEDGMEWQALGMPNEDAQFLETRTFQVVEIARWLGIPPHKLFELSRATFSNIEHQSIEFVGDSILPWAHDFEEECDRKLFERGFHEGDDETAFAEFQFSGMLRGDSKTRAEVHRQRWNIGSRTINEIRKLENEDPIDHPAGDWIFLPANMVAIDENGEIVKFGNAAPEPEEPEEEGEQKNKPEEPPAMPMEEPAREDEERRRGNGQAERLVGYLIDDIAGRLAGAEIKALEKRAKHWGDDPSRFARWTNRFYGEQRVYAGKIMEPLARHLDWATPKTGGLLDEIVASEQAALVGGDPERVLEQWQRQRAVELGLLLRKAVNGNGS